nr:protein phosphatase methylesterase 1 [Cryptococcus depauperatus CBS 7855]
MSDIFRKSVMNKFPQLIPTRAPWADEPAVEGEELEELAEEGDNVGDLQPSKIMRAGKLIGQDYSPLSAADYFAQAFQVEPTNSPCTFRAYYTPPVVAEGSKETSLPGPSGLKARQQSNPNGTVLICHHGGGASAMSFATLAREVKNASRGEMGVLASDCRGHGKTMTKGPKEADTDLSHNTLLTDFIALLETVFPSAKESPDLLLLGHSMGAAPVLSAIPILQQKGYTIPGVVILDVVEGTAIESLPLMNSIISKRPKSFKSVVDAIHWHVASKSIRNPESARVSVPHIIVPDKNDFGDRTKVPQVWRTDLMGTEPYWAEWYNGLSKRFLEAKCAKLLVLAGQERLDKELMVGQMQGKFQLEVMKDVGHYLHEDNPAALASTLVTFWRRNTRVLALPPKIGAPHNKSEPIEVKLVGQQ